ncbi:hypothetical protein B0F90DRAFT_1796521 [Multifurca ochricompacta]|uniref:Glycine-rich protein n=1 Tax=Multifurca ochricompacta TaxID=376703 RepID=A0AAD4QDW9_9AGAM|nr:hypothetical protein B0F90DRAFT_1796521 [Multifurca ochricompacta]
MFIPFLSSPLPVETTTASQPGGDSSIDIVFVDEPYLARSLERRKGGGGRGRGPSGGSSGSGSKGSGSKGSGSSGAKTSKVPLSGGSLPNGRTSATSYGSGGGRSIPIPLGRPFSGRFAGGGTRQEVYGNRVYGSGYPGVAIPHGVAGLGFPFFFWPVVWAGAAIGASAYLHDWIEYGLPDNSSRPGGPLSTTEFQSNSTGSTFHVLSDTNTISALIASVRKNCSSLLTPTNTSSSLPTPTPYTNVSSEPLPEQALQYYRASSVVLTLDGYNDTDALSGTQNPNATSSEAPLPNGTDTRLLACLNDTIGLGVPLVDAGTRSGPPGLHALVFAWMIVAIVRSCV